MPGQSLRVRNTPELRSISTCQNAQNPKIGGFFCPFKPNQKRIKDTASCGPTGTQLHGRVSGRLQIPQSSKQPAPATQGLGLLVTTFVWEVFCLVNQANRKFRLATRNQSLSANLNIYRQLLIGPIHYQGENPEQKQCSL